jgi:histone acetyltransferase MYST1
MLGTPERPLSEMGKLAYNSYWRTAIFEYIYQRREERELDTLSALEIAKATGIAVHDVVDVLKDLGFLSPSNGDLIAKNQK